VEENDFRLEVRKTMSPQLQRDQPAFYHIQVQGSLSPRWTDYLGGLDISVSQDTDASLTSLTGEIKDQAELLGILNSLYNLGFPLLFVKHESPSSAIL